MTEKIIINSVDVSGCEYYNKDNPDRCRCIIDSYGDEYGVCIENDNCYYKQLQRITAQYNAVVEQNKSLQAENIKIKADNSKLFEKAVGARKETDNTFERLQQKELEYERLSRDFLKQNEWLQQRAKESEELKYRLSTTGVVELYVTKNDIQKQFDRLKQALDEIESKINSLHYQTLIFHNGKTHVLADKIQETKNQITDIIIKAKGKDNE